eukprot:CAMPEP_0194512170 /NCGR_PEP_ID=MMETSP0253-20130528/44057_1 /TAXON_ID=2966 /ORGANISM="Noctiluca scintillans" /LENGTH=713 /DNA_ID=CAMNT_0039355579 /DNA_START=88 /DNA_END=2229 /DNA_ORIENTATION=+
MAQELERQLEAVAMAIPTSEGHLRRTPDGTNFVQKMVSKVRRNIVSRSSFHDSLPAASPSAASVVWAFSTCRTALGSAARLCPATVWASDVGTREYLRQGLLKDFIAGLTVTAILIPQGMAYGLLAEVPPVTGLHTALLPCLGYMVTGTCKHLSVGPFALISMLSAKAVMSVVPEPHDDPTAAVAASAVVAAIVGAVLVVLGFLRCGFIATFLSDSVLSGFCTAASLIIPLSQLKYAFQVTVPRGCTFFVTLWNIVHKILDGQWNVATVTIFVISLVTLVLVQALTRNPPKRFERFLKTVPIPGDLVVVVISTLCCWMFDLENTADVRDLGRVSASLPDIRWPDLGKFDVLKLFPQSLVVAIMTYITAMSVSSVFGLQHGYLVDSNQELVALGVANLLGCISSSFPAAASFSRSAVVASAGAASPLHNAWVVGMLVLVLLYFSPMLQTLPLAALAAIVVMAFRSLLQGGLQECHLAWHVSVKDFAMWNVAFWSTLLFDVTAGIAVAVLSDVLLLFYQTTQPSHTILARMRWMAHVYRNRETFAAQITHMDSVLIFRFHASLHFANREVFHTSLLAEFDQQDRKARRRNSRTTHVVCDFSVIHNIDMSACRMLLLVRKHLRERGATLIVTGIRESVHRKVDDMGLFQLATEGVISEGDVVCFRDMHDAVLYVEGRLALPLLVPEAPESRSLLLFGQLRAESTRGEDVQCAGQTG